MGDEVFTPEELVILGEASDPSTAVQETQVKETAEAKVEETTAETKTEEKPVKTDEQPEHTEEEKKAAEGMGLRIEGGFIVDDEGTKIPAKRWKSLYHDYKETQRGATETTRKFNLYRELGADKYYELYPEEKPAGYKPPATREEQTKPEIPANIGAMVVNGGPYNGQTLNDVYAVDPAYATHLQTQYLDSQREKVTTAKQQQESLKHEAETEITAFSDHLSTELFGKKTGDLSKEEEGRVGQVIQETLDWMAKTKRGAGIIADAYFLMNKDYMLKTAAEKGGKAALESLSKKPAIPSVDTTGGGTTVTDYEAMTGDQLAKAVEGMGEKEYAKFLKNAPASLRAKHPSLPWD